MILDITTNLHESVFGIIVYAVLAQFSCMNLYDALGVFCYLLVMGLVFYIWNLAVVVHSKIKTYSSDSKQWIDEHLAPLVTRLDTQLIISSSNNNNNNNSLVAYITHTRSTLTRNLWMVGYLKKSVMMISLFFGSRLPNF